MNLKGNSEMSASKINSQIRKIVEECLQISDISIGDEDNLVENLSINSIDAIGIFLMIEDKFQIQIEDDDLGVELISSIQNLANYIEKKRGASE